MSRCLLAIETSCDETAAAVVSDTYEVRSSVVASQIDLHAEFGGVVPELASRAHVELITPLIDQALAEAGVRGPGSPSRSPQDRGWSGPSWSEWPRLSRWPSDGGCRSWG